MIQLRQTVTYSLSIQAMIKGKMEDPAYQFSGRWPCRRSYSWSGRSGYPFTGRYPDRLSWHSTETGFERNDILSGCSKYHEYIRYCKNSIASALAEQIHKNFNYVIKSSSENGYNATVTTEITTFDSDSIWLIIRKSLINIWLLLTQLSMAPRNDTRNLSKFFWTASMIIPLLPSMM